MCVQVNRVEQNQKIIDIEFMTSLKLEGKKEHVKFRNINLFCNAMINDILF